MYPLLQIFQIIFQSFSFRSIGDMNKIGRSKKSGANPQKYSIFQGFDRVMKSKFYHSMISLLADISHNNLSFPL